MLEADRLRPLLAARLLVGVAILLCRLAGQARLEGMVVRPPHLGRGAGAAVAQRLDRGGEQQRLGRRHDLGPIALLGALRPENRELRRVENAAGDVGVDVLQLGDLRGEVVRSAADRGRDHAQSKPWLLMVAGKPCTGSLAAMPSGSLVSITPTFLLVGMRQPHLGEHVGDHARSPRRSDRSTGSPSSDRPCGRRTRTATDRPR